MGTGGYRDDDELLPIKFGPVSNGEFHPQPHSPRLKEVIRRTHRLADEKARRLGMSRRQFLNSVTGAAATLFVLGACSKEESNSRGERPGGSFDVSEDATEDTATALEELGGEEFIFDVQTHYVNYDTTGQVAAWTDMFPQSRCPEGATGDTRLCFTSDAYFREVYARSDTSMSILSALPTQSLIGLQPDDMLFALDVATRIGMDGRVLMHGGAYPHIGNIDQALMDMDDLKERYPIAAWKIYTMTPTEAHFYFDDHDPSRPQIGQTFIDHVRELGPPIICTHKGISAIVGSSAEIASPSDIGPAAARTPDVNFVVYHSGYEPGQEGDSGPYDPDNPAPEGVDRLIRSVTDAGLEPNSNVYAELGGTWWFIMRDPTEAAHIIGKLLKYIGEDRVVWGTDSIWFGTPQDQIQAMRTFQISEELQEAHGYPALTDEVKAKIFGINAARLYDIEPITGSSGLTPEEVEAVRASMAPARTYGPTTVRQSMAMIAAHMGGHAF